MYRHLADQSYANPAFTDVGHQEADDVSVPLEFIQAIEADVPLREALAQSGMSTEFQAMVIGLSAFRRLRPKV